MIIVEGPDGAGKTTVLERLSQELGLVVAPRACTSEGPVENLHEWVQNDLRARLGTGPSLHDRYPLISEMVYGPICRGKLAEWFDESGWYDSWMERLSKMAVVVWCLPSLETVVANVRNGSKQMSGVAERIEQIYGSYVALRAMWPRLVRLHSYECQVTWNYETDDVLDLVKDLRIMEVGL